MFVHYSNTTRIYTSLKNIIIICYIGGQNLNILNVRRSVIEWIMLRLPFPCSVRPKGFNRTSTGEIKTPRPVNWFDVIMISDRNRTPSKKNHTKLTWINNKWNKIFRDKQCSSTKMNTGCLAVFVLVKNIIFYLIILQIIIKLKIHVYVNKFP